MTDDEALKEYADNGVDLPELKDAPAADPEPKDPEPEPKEPEKEDPEAPKDPLTEPPKEPRKRSIYDDYKDLKSEKKTAVERAEQAEKERDELRVQIEEASKPKADADATKDAIAYAKEIGADPDLVRRIIEDAQRGLKPHTDPELKARLDRFDAWEKSNSKVIETQMFNEEFDKAVPAIEAWLPAKPSAEELKAIKDELDRISHTKEWHDKDLEYVAFKHKDTLSALVSPKKRGMESKDRKGEEPVEVEFNPTPDFSKMDAKEIAVWEKTYRDAGKSDGLVKDGSGKKLII